MKHSNFNDKVKSILLINKSTMKAKSKSNFYNNNVNKMRNKEFLK